MALDLVYLFVLLGAAATGARTAAVFCGACSVVMALFAGRLLTVSWT